MAGGVDGDRRHPALRQAYMDYEDTLMWCWMSQGIRDLMRNKDLIKVEDRRYVVGYICKVIAEGRRRGACS
jgi:hypothetical protein